MNISYFANKKTQRGFTLVELIVVLVILAILAAMLVPALTGYIDKANEKKILAEAHEFQVAVAATLAETYGLYSGQMDTEYNSFKCIVTKGNGEILSKCASITNFMLCNVQQGTANVSDPGTKQFATRMLQLLNSSRAEIKNKTARFNFANSDDNKSYVNCTQGKNGYYKTTKSKNPTVALVINSEWKLEYVEYARAGIMVRYDISAGTTTISRTEDFWKIKTQ